MELQRIFLQRNILQIVGVPAGRQAGRQEGVLARFKGILLLVACGAGPDAAAAIGRRISCGKQAGKQICSTGFLKRIIKIFAVV
jgi:hypothetical protein